MRAGHFSAYVVHLSGSHGTHANAPGVGGVRGRRPNIPPPIKDGLIPPIARSLELALGLVHLGLCLGDAVTNCGRVNVAFGVSSRGGVKPTLFGGNTVCEAPRFRRGCGRINSGGANTKPKPFWVSSVDDPMRSCGLSEGETMGGLNPGIGRGMPK